MTKEKFYLDTFIFMDILSGEPDHTRKATKYLEKMKEGTKCIVSSVLFSELSFHIRRKRGRERVEEVLTYVSLLPNLQIVPVSPDIARLAGLIRAKYLRKIPKKLTYFDCVHIATAKKEDCTKFITGDRGFRDIKDIKMEIY